MHILRSCSSNGFNNFNIYVMKTTYTYYKNSNSGELIKKQHFSEISFTAPDFFYDINGKEVVNPNLRGFVEVSQKNFNRNKRKQKLP